MRKRVHTPEQLLQEAAYRLPEHWIWRRDDLDWHEGLSGLIARLIGERLPEGRIVDVGCGDGKGTCDIARALGSGYTLSGTDYSERAIAFAHLMAPHIAFSVADAASDSVAGAPFDAIVFREVIEHLPDGEEVPALKSLWRGLREGGLLVLTTPHIAVPVSAKHFRHYSPRMLAERLEAAGFGDIEFRGFGIMPPRPLGRPYWWTVANMPIAWRICRTLNVETSPARCRTLLCTARRPQARNR